MRGTASIYIKLRSNFKKKLKKIEKNFNLVTIQRKKKTRPSVSKAGRMEEDEKY